MMTVNSPMSFLNVIGSPKTKEPPSPATKTIKANVMGTIRDISQPDVPISFP